MKFYYLCSYWLFFAFQPSFFYADFPNLRCILRFLIHFVLSISFKKRSNSHICKELKKWVPVIHWTEVICKTESMYNVPEYLLYPWSPVYRTMLLTCSTNTSNPAQIYTLHSTTKMYTVGPIKLWNETFQQSYVDLMLYFNTTYWVKWVCAHRTWLLCFVFIELFKESFKFDGRLSIPRCFGDQCSINVKTPNTALNVIGTNSTFSFNWYL